MALVYGIEVQKTNDPYVGIAERGLQGANMAGNVGTYLVDFIPACKCQIKVIKCDDADNLLK